MKIIIKNNNRDIVGNPNVKIVETTESTFTNQVVILENNDVPVIKYTDTQSMYFIKNLNELYQKSKSEILLDIDTDSLELIGGSSGGGSEVAVYCSTLHILEDRGIVGIIEDVSYSTSNIVSGSRLCSWDEFNTRLRIAIGDNFTSFIPSFVEVNLLNSVTPLLLFQEKFYDPINTQTNFYFVFTDSEGIPVIPNTFLLPSHSPLLLTVKIY